MQIITQHQKLQQLKEIPENMMWYILPWALPVQW